MMKISINFGEISSKYHILGVVEAKQGVEMSEGQKIQNNHHVSMKFWCLPINRQFFHLIGADYFFCRYFDDKSPKFSTIFFEKIAQKFLTTCPARCYRP